MIPSLVLFIAAILLLFWDRVVKHFRHLRNKAAAPPPAMTSPSPRVGLLDLPDELLIAIVSVVDKKSLLRVRQTSRHLKELSEPVIFAQFEVLGEDRAIYLLTCMQADRRRPQWLRSLLVSTRFEDGRGLRWMPDCLAMMRNLRHLRLETPDCNTKAPKDRLVWLNIQNGYESVLMKSTVAMPPNERLLQNLQTCTMHFVDDTKALYPMTKYSSVFLHPTLKSLTLSCACTDFPDKLLAPFQSDYRHTTNLEHLHLEECDFEPRSLAVLLSFPKALKSLVLSEGTRYDEGFGPLRARMHGNVLPHHLAKAITTSCGDSLELLSLDLGYKREYRPILTEGNFLDLTGLTRVKHLELSSETANNLVIARPQCDHQTHKRLPPNLETLKIFNVFPYGFSFRADIAANRSDISPRFPVQECFIKKKAEHGVPNLQHVIWSYQFPRINGGRRLEDFLRALAGDDVANSLQHLEAAKSRLASNCNKSLPVYKTAGIHMQVEVVEAISNYIPPYLYQEPKPSASLFWDSEAPSAEALLMAMEQEQAGMQDEGGSSSMFETLSDTDSEEDIDILDENGEINEDTFTDLAPHVQAVMTMLYQDGT